MHHRKTGSSTEAAEFDHTPTPRDSVHLDNAWDASQGCKCHLSSSSASKQGRNLVVCLDGTSNQFGENNTNVVELYHRIIKGPNQLTYYNSGIGTYARPSWRSFTYLKQALGHNLDLAIAWNFERIILRAYRWLSDNHKPGDRIFLFGFSRGAYQVRALAGMIEKVGLILRGNEEQIPFAYELYADLNTRRKNSSLTPPEMAERFKATFSRQGVRVHFLGVWDTVSSIGVVRGKTLPLTHQHNHVCYFRHALALDERRVKFLPEYVGGGVSLTDSSLSQKDNYDGNGEHSKESGQGEASEKIKDGSFQKTSVVSGQSRFQDHVKEVWFLGTHSDIGGGNVSNTTLNNAAVPVLWMGNEALMAGLRLRSSSVVWKWDELKKNKPSPSLTVAWWLFEFIPFKRLAYTDREGVTFCPNFFRGRVVKPGQRIHASVAFASPTYAPKAKFSKEIPNIQWSNIIGKGDKSSTTWISEVNFPLELDLFDLSATKDIVEKLQENPDQEDLSERLKFIALSREGTQEILRADKNLKTIVRMLQSTGSPTTQIIGCELLTSLNSTGQLTVRPEVLKAVLGMLNHSESRPNVRATAAKFFEKYYGTSHDSRIIDHQTIEALSHVLTSNDSEVRKSCFKALRAGRVQATSQQRTPESLLGFIGGKDVAVQVAGMWWLSGTVGDRVSEAYVRKVVLKIGEMLLNMESTIQCSAAFVLSKFARRGVQLIAQLKDIATDSLVNMLMSEDDEKIWSATDVLQAFASYANFRKKMLRKDIILVLLKTLRKTDEVLVLSAVQALVELSKHPDSISTLQNSGAFETLVNGMDESLGAMTEATFSEFLKEFAKYKYFRDMMLQKNTIPRFVDGVGSNDPKTSLKSIKGLQELVHHKDLLRATVDANGLPALVKGMTLGSFEMRSATLKTLLPFAQDAKLHAQIVQVGVIRSLVKILKSGNDNIKSVAIDVLKDFSQYAELCSAIVSEDVFPTLVNFLHYRSEVGRPASDALSAFAHHADLRTEILRAGVIYSLVKMLKSGDDDIKSAAADLLKDFSQYEELRAILSGGDVLRTLVNVLHYPSGVARHASNALGAFAQYSNLRAQIVQVGIIPSLVKILKSDNDDLKSVATDLLKDFSQHAELCTAIAGEDVFPPLINFLHYCSELGRPALDALSAFADNGDLRSEILQADVIDSLVNKILDSSANTDIKSVATNLLREFSQYEDLRAPIIHAGLYLVPTTETS